MPHPTSLGLFVAAAIALLVTPGPAVLYIVARSIEQGRVAGLVSAFGINTGALFHIAAAALGLSALLVSSALAFNLVKYLGAAYLIVLGLRQLFAANHAAAPEAITPQPLRRLYLQGMVVNLLNPKTALFFFAFLPQFVNPDGGPVALQVLFLGALFVGLAVCSDSLYALLAGTLGTWLRRRTSFWRRQRYFSGSIYILLGLTTAFTGSDHS